ncbi:MAG TPA: 2-C-methyl-D-erythritol 4-phosphate cytidylyltransferase, partial [Microthrixaceae bacterium]|nr:2-C-methyl-D-erythritol 4-phosphate cytidylyltransferase [Microthrixaceae bacterium]
MQPSPRGVWVIVVAGGSGQRFGSAKQFAELGGRSVIERAVAGARPHAEGVVVVVPEGASLTVPGADVVVVGGATRAGSVRAGLAAVPEEAAVVLVHDAARPLA